MGLRTRCFVDRRTIGFAALVLLTIPTARAQSLPEPTHALDKPVTSPPLVCGCPTGARKGDLSVTTSYLHMQVKKHFRANGAEADFGHVRADSFALGLDYAITERLAANFGVPYVTSSYQGVGPHDPSYDNGRQHDSFQDYRADLRYSVPFAPLSITPFIGFVAPSRNYTTFAHSAVGRGLHEQTAGINLGRRLEPLLPRTYLQLRYAYSFVEKTVGVSPNRSNLDGDLTYFVTPSLSVRGLWSLQKTYSPLNLGDPRLQDKMGALWLHHDQILRDDAVNVGAGATYAINDSLDLFATGLRTLNGRNGHKIDLSTNIGVTWTFSVAKAQRVSH